MSDAQYDMENPLVKDYLEKLNDLIRGELIVNNQEGMKLAVEGTLNLGRFLDCYINTRKEIKYELLTRVMSAQLETMSKTDIVKILKELINDEPVSS